MYFLLFASIIQNLLSAENEILSFRMYIPPHFCRPLHSVALDGRTSDPPLATPLNKYIHIEDRHIHKHAIA